MANNELTLVEALRQLLLQKQASTQEDICKTLSKAGYEVNQSKVSRLLRKIGAIKVIDLHGETIYSLPKDPAPPSINSPLRDLIFDVLANEMLVVIFTTPGSASMIARLLDHYHDKLGILGTIAGDDTIFVAPQSIKNIKSLADEIKSILK